MAVLLDTKWQRSKEKTAPHQLACGMAQPPPLFYTPALVICAPFWRLFNPLEKFVCIYLSVGQANPSIAAVLYVVSAYLLLQASFDDKQGD
jgi:hypothetical protein